MVEADAIIATLDDFASRIGLGELSGPAPVVHEYWELFDTGLGEVLSVAASPNALKKSVTVIAESVAQLIGVPWTAAKAFAHVAATLAESNANELVWTPSQIRAAAMDAFLIVDSALCTRSSSLDTCPSIGLLLERYGSKALTAELNAIAGSLNIPALDATDTRPQSRANPQPTTDRPIWSPFAPMVGDADFVPEPPDPHTDRIGPDRRSTMADLPEGFMRQLIDLLDEGEWRQTHRRERATMISGYLRHHLDLSRKQREC